MAYKRKAYKGVIVDADECYVCDSASDIASLPTNCTHGSRAFVIEDSSVWVADSSGQWSEISSGVSPEDITLSTLNVSSNGTINAPSGRAYSKVVTNVSGGIPSDPTDGKTHIWIRIDADTPAERKIFPLTWSQSVSNGVTVDWGDGTSAESFSGTGSNTHEHMYENGGEYEITLDVTSGTISFDSVDGTGGNAIYGPKSYGYSYNRARITRVVFGDGITSIGEYAMQYSNSTKYITIPSGVTSIGAGAFHNCLSLTSIYLPDSVTSIGSSAFYYCSAMESIRMSPSATTIGGYAFYNCYALKSIDIPDGVTVLDSYALYGCYNLTSIILPQGMTKIGVGAIDSCYGLTKLTIPASVTSIGTNAFSNCYGIKEYHFLSTTPPTLAGTSAFTGIASDCIIYVPYSEDHSVLNAYKSASNWATYASKIQEDYGEEEVFAE